MVFFKQKNRRKILGKGMTKLNISKTEFTAYLECPLKFYLMKQQNLDPAEGPQSRRDYSHFSKSLGDGLHSHQRLYDFFDEHAQENKQGV